MKVWLKRLMPIALILIGALLILMFAWRLPLPAPQVHYTVSLIVPYYYKDSLLRQRSIRTVLSRIEYDIKVVAYFNSFTPETIDACEAMDDLVVLVTSRNNSKTMESLTRTFPGSHITLVSATRKMELIADSVAAAVSRLKAGNIAPGVDYQ